MSGIITGPYFVSFFESQCHWSWQHCSRFRDWRVQYVLVFTHIITTFFFTRLFSSYIRCGRKDWRYRRSERTLCGSAVVFLVLGYFREWWWHLTFKIWVRVLSLRTIVPTYQSEIPPPKHVRHNIPPPFQTVLTVLMVCREVPWLAQNSRVILSDTPSQL